MSQRGASPLDNTPTSMSNEVVESQQRVRKSRRSAPKSRRGCLTCKIRHVKCDETQPACKKCTGTKRICDFLQASSTHLPVLHKLAPYTIPLKLRPNYALTTSSDVSIDAQNLDYFRKVCCSDFSGFFVDRLWEQVIPQQTVTEPSIRYAAMAIGAIHRSHAFLKGITAESDRTRAFANYTKALSALNSTLSNNPESRDLACLACLLFMVFEVCRGNDKGSMMHLHAGMKIVLNTSREISNSPPSGYMYELVSVFSRLDIQGATFALGYGAKVLTTPVIPQEFFSLIQAREVLDATIALMHFYIAPHGQATRHYPYVPIHAPLADEVNQIKTLLSIWLERFETYVESRSLKHTQRDHAAGTILRISHLHTTIFLQTHSIIHQSSYDAYLPFFAKIVEYAESAIEFAAKTQTHSGRRLAFDIATVQPLQYVARKCRNRTIRRRAVELSSIAGREGVWDGQSMAEVLRWIIAKEEENLQPTEEEVAAGLAEFGDEVPEEKDRVHGVKVDFDRLGQRCVIRTARPRDNDNWEGNWEYLEGSVAWGGQQVEKYIEVDLVTGFMR